MSRILSEERIKGNRIKHKILERDGYKCRACGSDRDLEVHHMQALVYGGKSTSENLITLCGECHAYAPDDGIESNYRYLKERNKVIYEQMINLPETHALMVTIFGEFLKTRFSEYVDQGFITEEEKEKLLFFESNKIF